MISPYWVGSLCKMLMLRCFSGPEGPGPGRSLPGPAVVETSLRAAFGGIWRARPFLNSPVGGRGNGNFWEPKWLQRARRGSETLKPLELVCAAGLSRREFRPEQKAWSREGVRSSEPLSIQPCLSSYCAWKPNPLSFLKQGSTAMCAPPTLGACQDPLSPHNKTERHREFASVFASQKPRPSIALSPS